jgi:HEAT repeat protein
LLQAVGADSRQWSAAVRGAVAELKQQAATDRAAVEALVEVATAEALRPVGDDRAAPPEAALRQLRELLERPPRTPGGIPPPPPPPPPPPGGNPAVERLRQPPTPEAIKALIEVALASSDASLKSEVVHRLWATSYPELGPLFEHVILTHVGGDTEAIAADALAGNRVPCRLREAACLLFLSRPDNFWNVQWGLLRNWRMWGGPRLAHILPVLLAAYEQEDPARQAAEALAEISGLSVPHPTGWSLPERAQLYRIWRDAPADRRGPALPPLIPPEWPAENPVVLALRDAVARTTVEAQRAVAVDPGANANLRRAALRRLAFEDTDDGWRVIAGLAEGGFTVEPVGYALHLATVLAPARAPGFRQALSQGLVREGPEGPRQLAVAILDANERDTLLALASLGGVVDKDGLCRTFEGIARGQVEPVHWQTPSWRALRNSVNAYGAIDPDRAKRFYRSLLSSDRERVRDVAIYAVGELRIADAAPELVPLAVLDRENSFEAHSVCVALGKISTPPAYDALVAMLQRDPVVSRGAWSVIVIMSALGGYEGRSPPGTWENGLWYTPPENQRTVALRFAEAMRQLADRTTDERLAREARGRAQTILAAGNR